MAGNKLNRKRERLLRISIKFNLILFCFLYVGLSLQLAYSAPFNFNGSWRTLTTEEDGFTESYLQSYNVNFKQDITEAMRLQESFRYSRNWKEDGGTREVYNPSLDFLIINDIFRFDLNGNASKNRNSEGTDLTSSSWQGIWSSTWQNEMWPRIQVDIGQNFSEDDESPAVTDTQTDELGSSVDWDFDLARILYNYDRRKITNNASNSDTDIRTNFARLDTGSSFWDDRLILTLSQQFSNDRRNFSIKGVTGGTVLVPVSLGQVAANIDDTPENGTLTPVPGLNDGNTDISALASDPLDLNISLKTDLQHTDLIYVYTVDDLVSTIGIVEVNSFRWNLYSSTDADSWQLEVTNLPFLYNSSQKRFEIDIAQIQKVHIKVVAVIPTPTGTVIDFSEVEAFNTVQVQGESFSLFRETYNYLTNANIGFSFNSDMNFQYSMSYDNRHNSDTPNQKILNQLGTFTWIYSPSLITSFSINETRNEIGDDPEDINRSYGLNFLAPTLPTLDMNFGITRRDIYRGSTKLSTTDSFNIYTTAALFPTLDLSLDCDYSITENEETDIRINRFDSELIVTARLNPKLTVDLRNEYDNINSDGNSRDVLNSTLNVSWRLSDMLLFQFTGLGRFDSDEDNDVGFRLNMSMVPSDETQFDITYRILDSEETTLQRTSFNFGWTIGQYFIFRTTGVYESSDEDHDWGIQTELVFRFNGF